MTTEMAKGSIFDARVEALVNPVNLRGVMGKGLALQFKLAFPAMFEAYRRACAKNELKLGLVQVIRVGDAAPFYVINFPTKDHWRSKSKLKSITDGLEDLRRVTEAKGIGSLAIPALGCGLGGLSWTAVRPAIESAFENTNTRALLFGPNAHRG